MSDENNTAKTVSAFRLRLGLVFFVLFWLPFWLIAPAIVTLTGEQNDKTAVHRITILVIAIQTIFGVIGLILGGKEVLKILRHTKYRKVPKVIWHILISGSIDTQTSH